VTPERTTPIHRRKRTNSVGERGADGVRPSTDLCRYRLKAEAMLDAEAARPSLGRPRSSSVVPSSE
jgi:hypothetical protein